MRTDVKLGVLFALVLVLAGGGYFAFRGGGAAPIPVAEGGAAKSPGSPATPTTITGANRPKPAAATPPAAGTPNAARPNLASRDGGAGERRLPSASIRPARTGDAGLSSAPPTSPNAMTAGSQPSTIPTGSPATSPSSGLTASTTGSNPVSSPPAQPSASSPGPSERSTAAPNLPASGSVASDAGASSTIPTTEPTARPTMTPLTSVPTPQTEPTPTVAPPVSQPAGMTGGAPSASPTPVPSSATIAERRSDVRPDVSKAAVETHRVQPGDTLSSLAQTYYGDQRHAKLLADANPEITNPNVLRLGSTVRIPAMPSESAAKVDATPRSGSNESPTAARSADGKRYYVVKSGDSFYSIARTQLGNANRWKELLSLNHALVRGDPTSLQPGQRVLLPES